MTAKRGSLQMKRCWKLLFQIMILGSVEFSSNFFYSDKFSVQNQRNNSKSILKRKCHGNLASFQKPCQKRFSLNRNLKIMAGSNFVTNYHRRVQTVGDCLWPRARLGQNGLQLGKQSLHFPFQNALRTDHELRLARIHLISFSRCLRVSEVDLHQERLKSL